MQKQATFDFEDEHKILELNIKESMEFLGKHLDSRFIQETNNSFRASLNDKQDVSILCLPLCENDVKYRYVVSVLAKNNTLKAQACFDCIATATEVANQHL